MPVAENLYLSIRIAAEMSFSFMELQWSAIVNIWVIYGAILHYGITILKHLCHIQS